MIGQLNHHSNFPSQHVPARHVDVWLPPSYAQNPTQRFGVLYMQDGQNLFYGEHSYSGVDWGIVPALQRLTAANLIAPVIVVGVWNVARRWQEYLPQRPFATPQGRAALKQLAIAFDEPSQHIGDEPTSDAYLRFLTTELKPFIDNHYRTIPDQAHTTIMGSSMGGLISLYALCQYPAVFGGAGCLSPHWPVVGTVIGDYLRHALPRPGQHRLYFDYGTEGLDAEYEPHQQQVDAILTAVGYRAQHDWTTQRFDGAEHSERAWRQRVHIPLQFLL